MRMRGRALTLLLLAGTVLLLPGSRPGANRGGPSDADTGGTGATITWLASSTTLGRNDPHQVLIDAFERAYPSIRVNLIAGPIGTAALLQTLRTRIPLPEGDTGPDVYLGDIIWPATLASGGLALPLSRYLPASFWDRFPATLVQGATFHGATYAAPFFSDQGLLYYRKDLLAGEHLPVPATWEELADEARILQREDLVRYGFVWEGAAYEGLTCVWTELMSDAGGRLLDESGTRSLINSPESLRALRFLRRLVTDGISPPEVAGYQELQARDAFNAGEVAFARNWNFAYDSARVPGLIDRVGVAPLPTFAGGPRPGFSTAGGWQLSVNPNTRHLAAVLTFVRWMTDTEAQEIMAREYHEIPTNVRVRLDPDVIASSPVLAATAATTPVLRPAGIPTYPRLSQAVYTNVNQAISGALEPERALQQASRDVDRAISDGAA